MMQFLKKWWWLEKRLFVYIPLSIVLAGAHILIQKHISVLSFLWYFPEPTAIASRAPIYNPATFGALLRAGFAKRDVTPYLWRYRRSVAGFYPPHPGLSIKDQIWVKSIAIMDGDGAMAVFVAVDVIGFLPDEIERIMPLVRHAAPGEVFLIATHNHSGPDTIGLWFGKSERYMQMLREKIAEAIDESVMNLDDSAIRFGQGEFAGYANGRDNNPADPTLSVIQVLVKGSGGRYAPVTLVNFAVHADVVQGLQISSDFPYFLSERLSRLVGGEIMFIPGAIGGVQPSGDRKFGSYLVRVLGENMADRVWRIMKNPIVPSRANIEVKRTRVSAPFENTSSLAQGVKYGLVPNLVDERGNVAVEIRRIRIGPAEILTVPGELFPNIWHRARSAMKSDLPMLFGMTNGEVGYIMRREDIESGKHRYHATLSIGPQFGEETDKALQRLAIAKE